MDKTELKFVKYAFLISFVIYIVSGIWKTYVEIKSPEKAYMTLEKHLKEEYGEEFVIKYFGRRGDGYEARVVYPKSYIGTEKEYDSYYWGRGFVDGSWNNFVAGDTYGKVVLTESANNFYLPKLKELFGENVLPVIDLKGGYTKTDFAEEMEIRRGVYRKNPGMNAFPISGGIYIFGRVENDKDREWYRKQIYEFVQFMKQTGTFEYVDLGIVIWDERVLSEEFRGNEELRKEILVARNTLKSDKEFIKERKKIMERTNESMKKITKEEKEKVLNSYIKSDIYGTENISKTIFAENKLLGLRLYSPKYVKARGWNKSTNPDMYEEIKNYNNMSDVKFTFEQY